MQCNSLLMLHDTFNMKMYTELTDKSLHDICSWIKDSLFVCNVLEFIMALEKPILFVMSQVH